MKKFLSLMLVVAFIIPCAFVLAACGGGLQTGVKYNFKGVEVVWDAEEKTALLEQAEGMTEEELDATLTEQFAEISFEGAYLIFNEDGSVTMGMPSEVEGEEDDTQTMYYKAEDNTVTLYEDEECETVLEYDGLEFSMKVDGNKLLMDVTFADMGMEEIGLSKTAIRLTAER